MRAWFNGRTTHFQCVRPGSIPGARTNLKTPEKSGVFNKLNFTYCLAWK